MASSKLSLAPRLTVDAVVERNDEILLIKRKNPPFEDRWALPGGFVEYGETVEKAVKREVMEEAGVEVELKGILGVYSEPGRDPRGHVVSVCFVANAVGEGKAGSDAKEARFFPLEEIGKEKLAFDHARILEDYARYMNARILR